MQNIKGRVERAPAEYITFFDFPVKDSWWCSKLPPIRSFYFSPSINDSTMNGTHTGTFRLSGRPKLCIFWGWGWGGVGEVVVEATKHHQ